jgi:diadenosine tetraphosphate (Ap4A) HIT family hydrolase
LVNYTISLADDVSAHVEQIAAEFGISAAALLAKAISLRANEFRSDLNPQWMPRERWDALVRGDDCPLCAEVACSETSDEYGTTIADLPMSRLRLNRNQGVAGYCVLVSRKHARELYDLDPTDRAQFVDDMMHTARALEEIFEPVKMNFEILGNSIPHLHCHIKPRFYGDPAPGIPIWPEQHPLFLSSDELAARAAAIRAALRLS